MRHVIRVFLLFSLLLAGALAGAAPPAKTRLLGNIELNRYVAPQDLCSVTLPFAKYDPAVHFVRDILLADSLNVLFEDSAENIRYRVELSDLHNPAVLDDRIDDRLTVYLDLVRRAYHDGVLPIFEGNLPDRGRAFYFHQGDMPTRYHLFYFRPRGDKLVMLWVDFLENDVTPEKEDGVINGTHPVVAKALHMLGSIK